MNLPGANTAFPEVEIHQIKGWKGQGIQVGKQAPGRTRQDLPILTPLPGASNTVRPARTAREAL